MRIFVTGASGFLGGFLVEELVRKRNEVIVLVRKTSNLRYLKDKNIKLVYGDVNDISSLKKATKDIDIVIHLASLIHPVNVPDSAYYKVNVDGTKNVFVSAYENNKNKLKQFINCSSVTVYSDVKDRDIQIKENGPCTNQMTIYGKTKHLAELEVKKLADKYNVPLTTLRPSRIYGERDYTFKPMLRLIKKRLMFNIGDGKSMMQPVYIKDCVEGILKVINNKKTFGRTYNLAGPQPINKKDFLRIIARNVGKSFPNFNIPVFVITLIAITNELICKPFKKDPFVSRKKLAFFLRSNQYDISAAKRDFGYDPKVMPEEGIRRTVEWYKKEGLV